MWTYPATSDVWTVSQYLIYKLPSSFPDFCTLWLALCSKLDKDVLLLACFIFRSLWIRRNYVVHGKELESPQQVVLAIAGDRDLFQISLIRVDEVSTNASTDIGATRW